MISDDIRTEQFFAGQPESYELYTAFEEMLYQQFSFVRKRVQKTQITFDNRHVFACASLTRVKPGSQLPRPYLTITIGLPYPLNSERVAVKTEPYPGRWTTHFVICSAEEIDEELIGWIRESYDFAAAK